MLYIILLFIFTHIVCCRCNVCCTLLCSFILLVPVFFYNGCYIVLFFLIELDVQIHFSIMDAILRSFTLCVHRFFYNGCCFIQSYIITRHYPFRYTLQERFISSFSPYLLHWEKPSNKNSLYYIDLFFFFSPLHRTGKKPFIKKPLLRRP